MARKWPRDKVALELMSDVARDAYIYPKSMPLYLHVKDSDLALRMDMKDVTFVDFSEKKGTDESKYRGVKPGALDRLAKMFGTTASSEWWKNPWDEAGVPMSGRPRYNR